MHSHTHVRTKTGLASLMKREALKGRKIPHARKAPIAANRDGRVGESDGGGAARTVSAISE